MSASRAAVRPAGPQVTVRCKVPGGPWFVGLCGLGGPEVHLGPYENPAVAREDAARLRQFLALVIQSFPTPPPVTRRMSAKGAAAPRESAPLNDQPLPVTPFSRLA
jgi:hypothetical protein